MSYGLKLALVFLFASLARSSELRAQGSGPEPTPAGGTPVAGPDSALRSPAPAVPDSGAPPDTSRARKGPKIVQVKRRPSAIDSMHVNEKAVLALHAVPSGERRSPADVARLVRDCDQLTTAVPPGDWDVFVIAAEYDLIDGVQLNFAMPDDWTIRGFTVNPEIKPMTMGDLRGNPRPCLIAFDCFARPDRIAKLPKGVDYKPAETLVIGRIELTAPSAGSLVLSDHSHPPYGAPKIGNGWGGAQDIPQAARGQIDVGQGPGRRPCATGGPLSPSPPEIVKKGGDEKPPR